MSGWSSLETVAIMEALVLNCGNLGLLLNNIWTWVALMTAALGLWRIRSVPTAKNQENPVRPVQDQASTEPEQATSTSSLADELPYERVVTKGNKYKACYNYSIMHEEDDAAALVVEWTSEIDDIMTRVRSQSSIHKAANPAMGWYSYQDMRVLDGSVVRLWDVRSN